MTNPDELTYSVLQSANIPDALNLVAEAGWNQVDSDWQVFLQKGEGFTVSTRVQAVERTIATACILPYEGGYGWISMMLVTEPFRRQGIASNLLLKCIDKLTAGGSVAVLDATPSGREVYLRLGFRDGWALGRWRRQAVSADPASLPPQVRPMTDADWPAVLALDFEAFGCQRSGLLAGIRKRSESFACVYEADNKISGFLLGRNGRKAHQLGPVVADQADIADALVSYACAKLATPLVVDSLDRHTHFLAALERHGFAHERSFIRMTFGSPLLPGQAENYFAIAGPELG